MDKTLGFMDLKQQFQSIKPEIMAVIEKVLDEQAVSGGPYVEGFEKAFAEYCGVKGTVACGNGTSALLLAMRALNIGPGDEVIVPANSFVATAWGPTHAGATPVFADCDPDTWNISLSSVEKKITPKTKAIIGVHLYGQPCDVHGLKALAQKHNLHFIEDCAQAHGARVQGQRIGSFGSMACFSFYPGKNLGAYGEAGAVVSNDANYLKTIASLRNHGSEVRYYHDMVGYNERMDGIQGAILSVKLRYLDQWTAKRQELARRYQEQIRNPKIKMQKTPSGYESVYHLFVATVENREAFVAHLKEFGISAGFHYPVPIHLQKAYANLGGKKGDCPNSEYLAEHCVSLPMFPELSFQDQDRVIKAVNSY